MYLDLININNKFKKSRLTCKDNNFFYVCLQFNRVANQNVLKVAGTRIFASWLYCTNFVSLNIGRTDVVRPAWLPPLDPNELPIQTMRTIKFETTTNGHRKWS